MSQTVQLDRESARVESRIVDPEHLLALVTLKGTRTYRTDNASKSSETRISLPWAISFDGGELVFRHRGVRMRDLANPLQSQSSALMSTERLPPPQTDKSEER
jgi:hypothetical protein